MKKLLLLLILAALPSWSAITWKQSDSVLAVTGSTTTTKQFPGANTNPGTIIVVMIWETAAGTCTITDSASNSYTAVAAQLDGTGANAGLSIQVFWANNTSTSQVTVTATTSTSSSTRILAIHEATGLATSSPVDQVNSGHTGAGSQPYQSGSITTTQADDLIFGACLISGSLTAVGTSSGYTLAELSNFGDNGTEYKIVASTGPYVSSFNGSAGMTSDSWVVAFKMAGGAARPRQVVIE